MPPKRRQLHDEFFKRAKDEGYLARSAYKLIEIDEKKRILRRGDAVLDLGCAPGSWMQVAEKVVGERGVVVGIDLSEVRHRFGANVHTIRGDIYATPPETLIGGMGQPFDVVMSDMAPNTSGHGDDFLSVRLCRRMIEILPRVLRPGGNTVMKVLEGSEFPELLNEVKALFGIAGGYKPKASRDVSREMFIWGKHYMPRSVKMEEAKEKNGNASAVTQWSAGGWQVEKKVETVAEVVKIVKKAKKPVAKTLKKTATAKKNESAGTKRKPERGSEA